MFGASFAWMALAQTGHALSFAAFHAGCMRRMAELFPQRRDMAAAQGLLYGFSGGIGGVAGAGVAAVAWQLGGGALRRSWPARRSPASRWPRTCCRHARSRAAAVSDT